MLPMFKYYKIPNIKCEKMSTRDVQIVEVQVDKKINVPSRYVGFSEIGETLRKRGSTIAAFSELIADAKAILELHPELRKKEAGSKTKLAV